MDERDWRVKAGDELVPGRRVLELLGGGVRYQAFLTFNETMLCPTVVKILRPDQVDDEAARRTIAAEAKMLQRLDHPSFLRLFGSDLDGERPFIELEFLDGPRLSTLIRRHGILLPEQIYPLARHLAAALHYMHSQGLLHLDVKPRNVIMGPVPRLIDLSLAREMGRVPRSPLGTDAYMPPEQCDRGRLAEIGPASDVWGLGATLYEAASKQLPFPKGNREGSDTDRWPQLVMEPAPPPAKVRPRVASLIMSCLAREPAARPTPLELFETLDEIVAKRATRLRFR